MTRCGQLDSLLQERRETLFSLEADRDQVGSVVSSELEGASAANGCTRSLGGIGAPGTIVVTRFPSVSVPVCVVASVPKCVLPSTPCVDEAPCVSGTTCAKEMARVSERPCERETASVRTLYVREMTVGMREHAAASPRVSVMVRGVSLVTRGSLSAWMEWRRRRRQRDRGRVAAVVILGTAPGLHGGEREVRAVQRTRPPRARLRE